MRQRGPFMIITAVTCAALVVALWLGVLLSQNAAEGSRLYRHSPQAFDSGWVRLGADGSRTAVAVPSALDTAAYEPVALVNTVPEAEYREFTLLFRSHQQEVRVELDGKPIYAYGELDGRMFVKTAPGHWNMVELPRDAGGKELKVTLTSAYKGLSGRTEGFWIGDRAQCLGHITAAVNPGMILSIVILFLGLFYLLAYFLMMGRRFNAGALLYWSLFTLLAGVWALGEARVDQLFFADSYIMWMATYTALFLLPFPIYGYIYISTADRELKRVARPLIAVNIGAVIICFLLQFFGWYDLWETRGVAQGLIVVCIILFLWSGLTAAVDMSARAQKVRAVVIIVLATVTFTLAVSLYDQLTMPVGNALRLAVIIIALLWGVLSVRRITLEAGATRELRAELKNQQLLIMAGQIRPHFIYNTLSAIHGQIAAAPELAEEMVYSFSKYLRANIDALTVNELAPFSRELEHIRTYARIEELRFIGRVKVEYDIGPDEFELPPLTVQPLVENAIKHGLCRQRAGGTVWVSTREEPRHWVVRVEDDGVGVDPAALRRSGESSSGIRNIRFRLAEMTGGTVEITERAGGGTVATVRIPRDKMANNGDKEARGR